MALNLNKILFGVNGVVPKLGSILGLSVPTLDVAGAATFSGGAAVTRLTEAVVALTDGAAIAIDAALGATFTLAATSNAARVFAVPTNGVAGQRITIRIVNTSGGALTLTTFNASIKQPALTYPASATTKEFEMYFDGTEWEVSSYSPANIPN